MPLTREPTKAVLKVAAWIRSQVPRPKRKPKPLPGLTRYLRWDRDSPFEACLPAEATPQRPPLLPWAIMRFWEWWDDQTDPVAAMDVIWPRKETP